MRRVGGLWLLAVLLLSLFSLPHNSGAQDGDHAEFTVAAAQTGVVITWQGTVTTNRDGAPGVAGWSSVQVGGATLPARLVAVRLPADAAALPRIEHLASVPWSGRVAGVERPHRPPLPTARLQPRQAAAPSVPVAPITLLRDGRMRGERVAVFAVHPIFEQTGRLRAATALRVILPGATLYKGTLDPSAAPFQPDAPARRANPVATGDAWTLRVANGGLQRVTAAALDQVGLDLRDVDASRLHLRLAGGEVPLEEQRDAAGRVTALWFYARTPGDRWNATDTYWLTLETTPGRRITTRDVTPASAPTRTTAEGYGEWRPAHEYDSTLPGLDGDHWFADDLVTTPGQPASRTVPLSPTLPLAEGVTTLTVGANGYTFGEHTLQVALGAARSEISWAGTAATDASVTLAATAPTLTLTSITDSSVGGVLLERVAWRAPVYLRFGGRGAAFDGVAGRWRYVLAGVPAESRLYDITDPYAPQRLNLPGGTQATFEDGPTARRYILGGPGTIWQPTVAAHHPVDPLPPTPVDALYIAPADFHAALEPLLALRRSQGHRVAVVDVQAIYDTWSHGQVAPDAIRWFLQDVVGRATVAPRAVTLVGDGTSDPRDYLGYHHRNVIPPYLALVDPWMGETACETCYAKLDGTQPTDDALPDLDIGRLSVETVAQLEVVVAKLLAYEATPLDGPWQARALYVADNYLDADGNPDRAGDFAAFAEQAIAALPDGMQAERVYYDPTANGTDPARIPGAVQVNQRTIEALKTGPGLATYVGHAHHYQWAVTDLTTTPTWMLGLYDTDLLRNAPRLPVVLAMTCLTSAFYEPSFSGTTIDERLQRRPGGGAAAIWGPTGLGLAYGHDHLYRGFTSALWKAPTPPSLGALTRAGYLELYTAGQCCQESLNTFALLGDPLTVPHIGPSWSTLLPVVFR